LQINNIFSKYPDVLPGTDIEKGINALPLLFAGSLSKGIYYLKLTTGKWTKTLQVLKTG
jgi:hypothetical protein